MTNGTSTILKPSPSGVTGLVGSTVAFVNEAYDGPRELTHIGKIVAGISGVISGIGLVGIGIGIIVGASTLPVTTLLLAIGAIIGGTIYATVSSFEVVQSLADLITPDPIPSPCIGGHAGPYGPLMKDPHCRLP